jgi:2',3'-cyclic-nucleotide 2'-phosphodiesterase / 3'-nucleotidase
VTRYARPPLLQAGQLHLRVLATTDLHMHLLPWDYYADLPRPGVGLARTADLIVSARAGAANSLLLDNGDILQGTPMGDLMAQGTLARGIAHPMILAMNSLGYDAATLGNHEFNYGLDFLLGALDAAAFPVTSANVVLGAGPAPGQDRTLLRPYLLLDREMTDASGVVHRLTVGVIGMLPPQIMVWDRDHLEGRVTTRDIVEATAGFLPEMREAGADIVIALCHSGIGAAGASAGMENAALALAALPGIDAVVTGHSHLVFPSSAFAGRPQVDVERGTLAGKPATMPGAYGSHLGLIDLVLEPAGRGWRVAEGSGRVVPVSETAVSPSAASRAVTAAARGAHVATLRQVRRPVGYSAMPLTTHFAMVSPVQASRVIAAAKRWHLAERLRGSPLAGVPILSTAAPFKAGGRGGPGHYTEVPEGPLAMRHVADLYPFPNTICALRVSGEDIAGWLERSAGAFLRITPGMTDQPLLDPEFPASSFDTIFGLTYDIDLSQPARFDAHGVEVDPGSRRIVDLRHAGRPVGPADQFIVATNSYRAGGGSRFPGASHDRIVWSDRRRNVDVLHDYIMARGGLRPDTTPVWRFHPLPGTSVLFDTSPRARLLPDDPAGLDIEPAGEGPDGFARFRIRL